MSRTGLPNRASPASHTALCTLHTQPCTGHHTHPLRRLHSSCILQARTCGAGMRCAPRHLARQVRLGTQARNSSSTMSDWQAPVRAHHVAKPKYRKRQLYPIPGPVRQETSTRTLVASLRRASFIIRRTSLRLPSHRSSSQNILKKSFTCVALTFTEEPFFVESLARREASALYLPQ